MTNLAGSMTKWLIENFKFDISFKPRKPLRFHIFVDLIVEMALTMIEQCTKWNVFTYGSSNNKGNNTILILESDSCLVVEVSLHLEILTTNNQVEYIAFIVDLIMDLEQGKKEVKIYIKTHYCINTSQ